MIAQRAAYHNKGEGTMSFGSNLQYLRRLRREMTQEALAEKLNVSRQTISRWEMNTAQPEMDKAIELCRIFNCTLDNLFREEMQARDTSYSRLRVEEVGADEPGERPRAVEAREPAQRGLRVLPAAALRVVVARRDDVAGDGLLDRAGAARVARRRRAVLGLGGLEHPPRAVLRDLDRHRVGQRRRLGREAQRVRAAPVLAWKPDGPAPPSAVASDRSWQVVFHRVCSPCVLWLFSGAKCVASVLRPLSAGSSRDKGRARKACVY